MEKRLVVNILLAVIVIVLLIVVLSLPNRSTGQAIEKSSFSSVDSISEKAELEVIFSNCDSGAESCFNVYGDGSYDCGDLDCLDVPTYSVNLNGSCGDVDGSSVISLLDVVYLINYLYASGPAPVCFPVESCADVDNSGRLNILDITYLISYLYKNGTAPDCGGDPVHLRVMDQSVIPDTVEQGETVNLDIVVENYGNVPVWLTYRTMSRQVTGSGSGSSSGGGGPIVPPIYLDNVLWNNTHTFYEYYTFYNVGDVELKYGYFGIGINGENETELEDNYAIFNVEVISNQSNDTCSEILCCSDYATVAACVSDPCLVIPNHESSEGIICGIDECDTQPTWYDCGCSWDSSGASCGFDYTEYACNQTNETAIHLDCDELTTIYEGEQKLYESMGDTYLTSIVYIHPYEGVKFNVNGELTNTLSEGQTYILQDGVHISVYDIMYSDLDNVTSGATIGLNSSQCTGGTNQTELSTYQWYGYEGVQGCAGCTRLGEVFFSPDVLENSISDSKMRVNYNKTYDPTCFIMVCSNSTCQNVTLNTNHQNDFYYEYDLSVVNFPGPYYFTLGALGFGSASLCMLHSLALDVYGEMVNETQQCYDSDGGINYDAFGYANKNGATLYDYCPNSSNSIYEVYCNGFDEPDYARGYCNLGCFEGVCQRETRSTNLFQTIGKFFRDIFGG